MDVVGYVNSTDTFMSGWGKSEGKTNRCTVPVCNAYEEEIVIDYIKSRTDQKNIRFSVRKPSNTASTLVSDLTAWRDTSARWYLRNYEGHDTNMDKVAKAMLEEES